MMLQNLGNKLHARLNPRSTQPLTHHQLFHLQLKTLENRIQTYYHESQNSNLTIQYILALRVRYQLGAQEFAEILKDLVRHLFLKTKATRTMKRFFYYFQDYFLASEWRSLKLRVFPVRHFGETALSIARSIVSLGRPEETNEP